MEANHWETVDELFAKASELEATQCDAFLAERCVDQPEVRQEVERLLTLDREVPPSFLAPYRPPDQIGPYRIQRALHRGGMSVVYLATREKGDFPQTVAIKVTAPTADRTMRRRFEVERRILARLQHPHIARLYDGGTLADGRPFLVMEYIDGIPITDYCDRQRLPIADRVRLFLAVLDAVDFAHRHLVVHRDLKPGNVLITGQGQPKLLDFGIAKLQGGHTYFGPAATTQPDERLLTPGYASPEQTLGEPIGVASDVYSAGVLLYELLAGIPPYTFSMDMAISELVLAICARPPLPLAAVVDSTRRDLVTGKELDAICRARATHRRELRTALRSDLLTIVDVALRKEPARRYSSIATLANDLRRFLASRPLRAKPDSLPYRARKFVARNRLAVVIASLLMVTAIAFFGLVLRQNALLSQERDKVHRSLGFLVDIFSVSDADRAVGESIPARKLLERGAQRALEELDDEPEVQHAMLATLGRIYHQIGLDRQARELLEEGLARNTARRGGDPLQTATILHHLSEIATTEGRLDEARARLERSFEIRRRRLSPNHPDVAASLEAFGALHILAYEYERAEAALRQAEMIRRSHDAPAALARTLEALAEMLTETDRKTEAATLIEESLALRLAALGPDHPDRAMALRRLATLRITQGAYGTARPLYEEALRILRQTLGTTHQEVSAVIAELASCYFFLDLYPEAEARLRESLDIQRQLAGDTTPRIANDLGELSVIVRRQGRYGEADAIVTEHLALTRRFFGDEHPKVAYGYFLRAGNELERGDLTAAERAIQRTLAINRASLPPDHRAQAYPMITLARIRLRQDRYPEAENILRQAIPILAKSHAPNHWRLSDGQVLLAISLGGQGRLTEAEALAAEALVHLPAQLMPTNPAIRRARDAYQRIRRGAENAAGMEPYRGGWLTPPLAKEPQ